MSCPSHPPLFDHTNYTWQRVQVMELLVIQFSPASYCFIPLRPIYSPSAPSSQIPLVCVLPLMSETKFHTHMKLQTKSKFCIFLDSRSGDLYLFNFRKCIWYLHHLVCSSEFPRKYSTFLASRNMNRLFTKGKLRSVVNGRSYWASSSTFPSLSFQEKLTN
jgi:hypothetical protein